MEQLCLTKDSKYSVACPCMPQSGTYNISYLTPVSNLTTKALVPAQGSLLKTLLKY